MREIKYRVWNTISKTMKPFSEIKRCGVFAIADGLNNDDFIILPLKNSILNEYVGLKDKNDVEIYEGDIVRDSSNRIMVVEWDDRLGTSRFILKTINEVSHIKAGRYFDLHQWITSGENDIEVIGNIYENPELIEVTNEP